MTITLDGENGVHQVLERTWTCQRSLLGHVSDQDHRRPVGLGEADEHLGAGADLGEASRRARHIGQRPSVSSRPLPDRHLSTRPHP